MKTYSFTKYDGVYFRSDSIIAVNKSGLIRLTAKFCRDTGITDYPYVLLFFDIGNNAIAFMFTDVRENGVLKVTKDKAGASISAKSFFGASKLNLEKWSGRYDWEKKVIKGIGEVYIIELKNR